MNLRSIAAFAAGISILGGCATIPQKRYGVAAVKIEGMKDLDEASLKACLATKEHDMPSFDLSTNPEPECGTPPFNAEHLHVPMWPAAWPWTDWPLFDRSVFERDLDRVARWYRARGYYNAHVASWYVDPPEAAIPGSEFQLCEQSEDDEGCELRIWLLVHEGQPVRVHEVTFQGIERLPPALQEKVRAAVQFPSGSRFDEAIYEQTKQTILRELRDASYAKARVLGNVQIDPKARVARIHFKLDVGPSCVFGSVRIRVQGRQDIPGDIILRTALIERGEKFSVTTVEDAQRAVYGLGAFSSVAVEPRLEGDGHVIDVDINLITGRLERYGVGAGLMSGLITRLEGYDATDVRQWDIHLLGFVQFWNLFNRLERIRLEERPRLVFRRQFPLPERPAFGNILSAESRWPAFLEGRTTLVAGAQWDVGPDPFGRPFQRNDVDLRVGPQRDWTVFKGNFFLSTAIHYNLYYPFDTDPNLDIDLSTEGIQKPSEYRVLFLEQYGRLDLRDNPTAPRKGIFFGLSLHEAGYLRRVSSWSYLRTIPDVRGYIPLPFGIVIAARVRLGMLFIFERDPDLDTVSSRLGPYAYRLRGGGATSNRGYLPGQLGDGFDGGLRRWEASLEFRFRLTATFGAVLFVDAGDVIAQAKFRFDRPQISAGLGLRIATIVGPLRFDLGSQVPGLQTLSGTDDRLGQKGSSFTLFKLPTTFHLTIGEAF